MTPDDLSDRLDALATDVLVLVNRLPSRIGSREVFEQVARASNSASSNYNAARRGRSRREFIAKLGIAVEEADETVDWLGKMGRAGLASLEDLAPLTNEARQLRAILASSYATARRNSHGQ